MQSCARWGLIPAKDAEALLQTQKLCCKQQASAATSTSKAWNVGCDTQRSIHLPKRRQAHLRVAVLGNSEALLPAKGVSDNKHEALTAPDMNGSLGVTPNVPSISLQLVSP